MNELEDHDDVKNVYANFDIPKEIIESAAFLITLEVLGIDPGLATTGWGVITKTDNRPAYPCDRMALLKLRPRSALPSIDCSRSCAYRLTLSLSELHKPSLMAIEELFFTKFAVSIAATAQARGVILLTAAEQGLEIVEYNPRAVKMAMTGFGSASKIQMQSMLQQHFRLKELPRPDDAADALAIALCHVQTRHEFKVSSTRKSRAAFEAEMAAQSGSGASMIGSLRGILLHKDAGPGASGCAGHWL